MEMSILQIMIALVAIFVIANITTLLYRRVRSAWQWHQFKKASANLQKCMGEFFSNLPPRESEYCEDCKYSEVSINNGNLLCLHERSRHFGEALAPEQDMGGFCCFDRKE